MQPPRSMPIIILFGMLLYQIRKELVFFLLSLAHVRLFLYARKLEQVAYINI